MMDYKLTENRHVREQVCKKNTNSLLEHLERIHENRIPKLLIQYKPKFRRSQERPTIYSPYKPEETKTLMTMMMVTIINRRFSFFCFFTWIVHSIRGTEYFHSNACYMSKRLTFNCITVKELGPPVSSLKT